MGARGLDYLHKWLAEHLPKPELDSSPVAASELADQLLASAEHAGIGADEVSEEVESVPEVVFEAMQHQAGGSVD